MNVPNELKYTQEHEWIRVEADHTAYVGITDYAQRELGDIVYIEIETEGEELEKNTIFGTIEAVKTVSDLYLPVTAKILEVNSRLSNEPEIVNTKPYEEGWMIKIQVKNPEDLDELMSSESYQKFVSE